MADKRTFDIAEEQALFIDRQVSSGAYETEHDVIDAGLRALQDREQSVENWLRSEVAIAYDEAKANPDDAIPAEVVFAELRARHAARFKD